MGFTRWRSIPGSSPRSVAESHAESIDDEHCPQNMTASIISFAQPNGCGGRRAQWGSLHNRLHETDLFLQDRAVYRVEQ